MSNIEKILMNNDHIIKIHPAEEWEDFHLNSEKWNKSSKKLALKSAQILKEYLNMPYIEDNFGSEHHERREWEEKLESQYGNGMYEFLKNNALKGEFPYFTLTAQLMGLEEGYLEDKKDLKVKFDEIYETIPNKKDYHFMPTNEKIKNLKNLKNKIHSLLKFLSH